MLPSANIVVPDSSEAYPVISTSSDRSPVTNMESDDGMFVKKNVFPKCNKR